MPCITKTEALDRMNKLHKTGIIDWINLQPKIKEANEIIKCGLAKSDCSAIAFSGGKDSIVVLDLVRSLDHKIKAVFCNTGIEYVETIEFIKTIKNVEWLDPQKSFWECAKEYGMPVIKSKAKSHGNMCCKYLKEKPAYKYYKQNNINLVFTGLTMDESRNRMMMLKRMGPLYLRKHDKQWQCHPIHNWSEKDVWTYIKWLKLKYNKIYDLGIRRCGCRFCTAYISWKEMTSIYNINDTKLLLKKTGDYNKVTIQNTIDDELLIYEVTQ